jgi:RNAse (barnase) inhibitor barstar
MLAMGKREDRQLRQLISQGGEFSAEQIDDLRELASEAELFWCQADCSKARNRSALFRAVVKATDYPQFFGNRFEGLYDCLCDTIDDQKAGVCLVFSGVHSSDPDLERDLPELTEVLKDVVDNAAKNGRLFLYCIDHAGKHADDAPGVVHNWSQE